MDLKKLEQDQKRLARRVVLRDEASVNTIAGFDIAYTGDNIICAAVVMDYPSMVVREVKTVSSRASFPYIPGFLAYREAPVIIETYHELELEPDAVLVDGNGVLHPRRFGLACAVGLALDKVSIGVAKSLLMGQVRDTRVFDGSDRLGYAIMTKDKAKPIYVSPGHNVSFTKALEIVRNCIKDHKLPEPLHEAHKAASKVRRKIKDANSDAKPI